MKIAISGYYGFNNTGDEAVLDSVVSKFREKDPGIRITVFSSDPKATSSRFAVDSVNRLDPFSGSSSGLAYFSYEFSTLVKYKYGFCTFRIKY